MLINFEVQIMRWRFLSFGFTLFCAATVCAQTKTPPAPPGITVVDSKWEKVRFFSQAPPSIPPPEVDENTGQVKPPNNNSDLRRPESGEFPADARLKATNDAAYKNLWSYYLLIKIKNSSPRKIRSVAYDYVFLDPGTKQELRRLSRRGFQEIGEDQTKWVKSMSVQGPPQQVSLAGLQKDKRSPFDERVEIKCIVFSDGTGWKAPDAEQKVCDELLKYTLNPLKPRRRVNGVYRP